MFVHKPPCLWFSVIAAKMGQESGLTEVCAAHLALYHLLQRLLALFPPHNYFIPKYLNGDIWVARREILKFEVFSFPLVFRNGNSTHRAAAGIPHVRCFWFMVSSFQDELRLCECLSSLASSEDG